MKPLVASAIVASLLLFASTAYAQTPEPTAIKYPDATASPAVKAAFTQALEKCQAEVREDYASKITKAVAAGKPHLVTVYERRREATLVELCQSTADIAAMDQNIAAMDQNIAANRAYIAAMDQNIAANRAYIAAMDQNIAAMDQNIAAMDQNIAAMNQEIAAGKALGAAYDDVKRIANKITSGKETPKDIADLQVVYQYLQTRNAEKPELGIQEVLTVIEPVLAKYKRLQTLK